jgi:beta-lactamase class D
MKPGLYLSEFIGCCLLLVVMLADSAAAAEWLEQPGWASYFDEQQVQGTMVVVDQRRGQQLVYNARRAGERFLPASTFKIPHTLFALDAGIAEDEFQIFSWDHVKRWLPAWNQDQTLRSALRYSTIWVYQNFAVKLGEDREREYLQQIQYGNMDPAGGIQQFWLSGQLRISALEQVDFLQRLYRNTLPFSVADQRLVKDLMVNEAGQEWILRAKSGWASNPGQPATGWWVGWVECVDGPVFFAINISSVKGMDDAPKRQAIARKILQSIGALPAAT